MTTFKSFFCFLISIFLVCCNPPKTNQEEGITDVSDTLTVPPEFSEEAAPGEEDYSSMTLLEFCEDYGLNTLAATLKASGLADSLQGGSFTIFAPSDAAFDELPEGTVTDWMKPENAEILRSLLAYHIIPADVPSIDLVNQFTITTLSGKEVVIREDTTGMLVNDAARILDADLKTQNGLVHVVNKVLFPPGES